MKLNVWLKKPTCSGCSATGSTTRGRGCYQYWRQRCNIESRRSRPTQFLHLCVKRRLCKGDPSVITYAISDGIRSGYFWNKCIISNKWQLAMFVMHIIGSKTEFASLPADQSYLAPEKVNAPQSAHIKSLRGNHQEDCMGGGYLV